MCKAIGHQADSTRGISIGRHANEVRLDWNAPLHHEADHYLKEALDHYFGPGNKWHFYANDKKTILLVNKVSKVLGMLKKRLSKFFFLKTKKE